MGIEVPRSTPKVHYIPMFIRVSHRELEALFAQGEERFGNTYDRRGLFHRSLRYPDSVNEVKPESPYVR